MAISDVHGDYYYEDVYLRSWDLAKGIIGTVSTPTPAPTTPPGLLGHSEPGQRICYLCPTGLTHVITTWACWIRWVHPPT